MGVKGMYLKTSKGVRLEDRCTSGFLASTSALRIDFHETPFLKKKKHQFILNWSIHIEPEW